ncbi:2OG-Fe(II) oxygenase [Olivibacter sp. CPCC 100613]|uniref:2OG-Fe(II) oxygenase n=1 Tax=Olivibacter sp. CPCC 100613 TaxID=3079931 RepID=UPI002FFA3D7D
MEHYFSSIEEQDWTRLSSILHKKGFAIIKNVIPKDICKLLIESYNNDTLYRKTVIMEKYRFGLGEYKYYNYPLPPLISSLREMIYPKIVSVANQWMNELNLDTRFPLVFNEMQRRCQEQGQMKPTVLILKYQKGGFNTLHQDLYGPVYFPLQLVVVLNQIEKDYTGGEFVITEQIPRAQSKAHVLQPDQGDLLIFTTSFRSTKGTKGFYKINMKHGVSPLHGGQRYALGIIFHDALS